MTESMGAELGLIEDKQFITNCHGTFTLNNNARNLCGRFIPDGTRFYDAVSRYDDICSYVLTRDTTKVATAIKMIVPFLISFNVTDHMAYQFSKEDLRLAGNADKTINYLYRLLPVFISTGSLEHHMMAFGDVTGFPVLTSNNVKASLDEIEINRLEMKRLREFANNISKLNASESKYINIDAKMLDDDDTELLVEMDKIFQDELPKMDFYGKYEELRSIGLNEKAYSLLEIRRKTDIDLSSTIYVGGNVSDAQSLDLVRDSSGLAISFNGIEHAVMGCNVAVMGNDTTVLSVLAEEFYDGGIESVFSLIDDWTPAKLRKRVTDKDCPLNTLLEKHPKRLPIVKKVDRHNATEIANRSAAFRKKLLS